jgi:hypothetical protein
MIDNHECNGANDHLPDYLATDYVFGELDESERRKIEARMVQDKEFFKEVAEMYGTVELLRLMGRTTNGRVVVESPPFSRIGRRWRLSRVAVAATLFIAVGASATAYVGHILAQVNPEAAASGPAGSNKPMAQGLALKDTHDQPTSTSTGRRRPNLSYREYLKIGSQRFPLYGPDNEGGLASDWTYAYTSPVRVASVKYEAPANRLNLVLGFSAPEASLAEAKARIEAKSKAHVTLVPIPLKWYEISLRDTGSGEEHSWHEDAGGPAVEIYPPARKVIDWQVPERLGNLRRLLTERPEAVTVRVRACYNFQTIAFGVIRTGVLGGINEQINEVIHPVGEDRVSAVLLVSRDVQTKLHTVFEQKGVHYVESAGLGSEEWTKVSDSLSRVVNSYIDRLPVANLGDLLDATDQKFIYRVRSNGEMEARPLLTKNKILQSEHEAEYRKKARDFVKTIRDVARDNKDARKFRNELKQRLKIDGSTSVDVVGIFGGDLEFHLDKDEQTLTTSDVEQISKSRDYFLGDKNREEEINQKVKDKVNGELIEERAWAKTIQVVRLDRRELAQRIGSTGEFIKPIGFEDVVVQSEPPLEATPDPKADILVGGSLDYYGRAETVPENYLIADGRDVRRDEYPELFQKLGIMYGRGDGQTTFNLPDLRGEFSRGADDMGTARGARGVDGGRTLGSLQTHAFQQHAHNQNLTVNLQHRHRVSDVYHISCN